MKILIIGGSSLLGRYLLQTEPDKIEDEAVKLYFTYNRNISAALDEDYVRWYQLDIRNHDNVKQLFEIIRPNIVIHCAAIGGVDYAKKNYGEVADVNIIGARNVATSAYIYNCHMVHISTNAVFDGSNPPYKEESAMNPVNDYGIIKRQAETVVKDLAKTYTIIRPFLLYGWPYPGGRQNWATSIIARAEQRMGAALVNDNIWMPTYAGDVAGAIWQLCLAKNEVFNVAAPERATLYEFGLKVCEVFGLTDRLKPVDSDYFPTIARRPHDTTYDLAKTKALGITLSDIKSGLEKMRDE